MPDIVTRGVTPGKQAQTHLSAVGTTHIKPRQGYSNASICKKKFRVNYVSILRTLFKKTNTTPYPSLILVVLHSNHLSPAQPRHIDD